MIATPQQGADPLPVRSKHGQRSLARAALSIIIKALVEGNSIRSTARLLKADKETVMGLGLTVGLACFKLHDKHVKGLHSGFAGSRRVLGLRWHPREAQGEEAPRDYGDAYTFFAIDNETKVVPSFYTGTFAGSATRFMKDLRKRVRGKPQISVDGWPCWAESVLRAFGLNGVHLGSMVKEYQKRKGDGGGDTVTTGRIASKSTTRTVIFGEPDKSLISTAIAERLCHRRAWRVPLSPGSPGTGPRCREGVGGLRSQRSSRSTSWRWRRARAA